MRLEYRGEGRWAPLQGAPLINLLAATGAQAGPGLPDVLWQSLPFYDATALIRVPDPVGGLSEWYITSGGKFYNIDKFGITIAALNERAPLRLSEHTVAAYFRFWCAFTTAALGRFVVLDISDPELAEEAMDETDPLLRGVVVEGHSPQGFVLSATVFHNGSVQRRNFRISLSGQIETIEGAVRSLDQLTSLRRAS